MQEDTNYCFDDQIQEVADLILSTYADDPVADRMDTFNQPDQQIIIEMINKLLRLMYPGFWRKCTTKTHSTKYNLTALIKEVAYKLKDQIVIAIRKNQNNAAEIHNVAESQAQTLTSAFFKQIPKVRELLKTDLQAFYNGDPAAYSMEEIIIAYPGLLAISIYRLAHELWTLHIICE